ncbi:hypothetical protein C3F00_042680, partial [Pseudomonas sp. MWU13-2860]
TIHPTPTLRSSDLSKSIRVEQKISAWGQPRAVSAPASPSTDVSLIPGGVNASAKDPQLADGMTPMLSLIKDILEKVLVVKSKVVDGTLQKGDGKSGDSNASAPTPQNAPTASALPRFGGSIQQSYDYKESESMGFSAKGSIKTQDGREFNFSLDVQMSRSFEYH